MDKNKILNVIDNIKKKKSLESISNKIVEEELSKILNQNPKLINFIKNERSKEFKKIVKLVRNKLHITYGIFQTKNRKKLQKYFSTLKEALKNNKDIIRAHEDILSISVSSKERLNFYQELYKSIFKITGIPESILDLGCGFNPFSYPFMGINKLNYYAYDINEEDCKFLNNYFNLMSKYTKLEGKAEVLNLKDLSLISKLPATDVCFLFKTLDPLEQKGHKFSEQLISLIKSKWVIVSFSTKTISGKQMKHPYRGWIERMLNRINLKFEKLRFPNEFFYIIKNH